MENDTFKRLLSEHAELCDRINKLVKFIASEKFQTLTGINCDLLEQQLSAMTDYRNILELRINLNHREI